MSKTILTYGTFDLFHVGHLNLLRRLKGMGDRLIVGVSTDTFNEMKGKKTIISFEQRIDIVQSIRYVDLAIPESCWEQKLDDIRSHEVDIFAMGNDWEGKFDFLKDYCEVVYLPRTEDISSTSLKNLLSSFDRDHIEELKQAIDLIGNIVNRFE